MSVPTELIEQAAERFRLLIRPHATAAADELDDVEELAVGELAERAGVGLSNTSKHLHQLEREGIVAKRRAGRRSSTGSPTPRSPRSATSSAPGYDSVMRRLHRSVDVITYLTERTDGR